MFLIVCEIIFRIFFGLWAFSFILSACLYEKHKIFKYAFAITSFSIIIYGVFDMFLFAFWGI